MRSSLRRRRTSLRQDDVFLPSELSCWCVPSAWRRITFSGSENDSRQNLHMRGPLSNSVRAKQNQCSKIYRIKCTIQVVYPRQRHNSLLLNANQQHCLKYKLESRVEVQASINIYSRNSLFAWFGQVAQLSNC